MRPHNLTEVEDIAGGLGTEPPAANAFLRIAGGLGAEPPTHFYGFYIKKNSFQHTFLSKKHIPILPMSAVTIIV